MKTKSQIFHHDNPFTVGVEEEYMICHPESGELINKADDIMKILDDNLLDRYSYELILSEIEINTSVCTSVNDVIDEISFLRKNTKELGAELGFKIGISGTHPTGICNDQHFVNNKSYGWVADQLSYYAKRNITFAMHVHVAVPNEDYAIRISNSLRQWISPLLALSTNSPFFEGERTGIRSSRTMQFGSFPRTNIPIKFNDFKEYELLVEKYINSRSIELPRQIWWKIRPHMEFGTIEFRMCDMQRSLKNVEMIAAISQSLVHQSARDMENDILIESFNLEYLNDALWKASRFPFNMNVIDPERETITTIHDQILKMKHYVQESLEYFGNQHINKHIDYILENGTECDQQINVFEKDGIQQLKEYLINSVEYDYN